MVGSRPVAAEELAEEGEGVGAGEEAPGGRQVSQTAPPSGMENEEWGPVAPHTAQSKQEGAQPARARARSV